MPVALPQPTAPPHSFGPTARGCATVRLGGASRCRGRASILYSVPGALGELTAHALPRPGRIPAGLRLRRLPPALLLRGMTYPHAPERVRRWPRRVGLRHAGRPKPVHLAPDRRPRHGAWVPLDGECTLPGPTCRCCNRKHAPTHDSGPGPAGPRPAGFASLREWGVLVRLRSLPTGCRFINPGICCTAENPGLAPRTFDALGGRTAAWPSGVGHPGTANRRAPTGMPYAPPERPTTYPCRLFLTRLGAAHRPRGAGATAIDGLHDGLRQALVPRPGLRPG